MRIIITGASQVGIQLAKYLIQEKHDVSLIEINEERARQASNRLDCMVIQNNGNNPDVLRDAGIEKADALVCVTDSDELNMIICGLAASHFGNNVNLKKIARVNNDDYIHNNSSGEKNIFGVDYFIHPAREITQSVIKAIERGVVGDVFSFSGTTYELGSFDISKGSALDGLILSDYRKLVVHESLVTLVERGDKVMLPTGATVLQQGDRVHILANSEDIPRINNLTGDLQRIIKKIGIVGGGKLGSLIIDGLINGDSFITDDIKGKNPAKKKSFFTPILKLFTANKRRKVIVIEQDRRLCNDIAARFPDALVLNEDISDESFVNEEELDDLDCLISTTNNQELNIITAVYMKSRGIARTITMVSGSGHAAIARRLGIDVVISMQSVVVDSILSRIIGGGIKEVHLIGDGKIELYEVEVKKDAPVIDKPISSFKLSNGGLLMLVNRGGNSFIPKGGYIFNEGDHIVLIARSGCQAELEKYFGVSK